MTLTRFWIYMLMGLITAMAAGLLQTGAQAESVREVKPSLNLYSAQQEHLIRPILEKFEAETGIAVHVTTIERAALNARLELEGKDTPADAIVTVDVGNLYQLQAKGLLQPVTSEILEANIPAQLRDKDNHWFGFTTRARVIYYAKGKVNPDDIKTYADLADPKWQGKLLIRSSDNVYNQSLLASIIAHEGRDAALAWAKGVVANMARAPEGGDRDQLHALASGVGDIAVANTYYYARMLADMEPGDKEAAAKIGIIFPNQAEGERGAHVNIRGGAVAKYAKHPELAVKLLEYLSRKEAQTFFANDNFEYPADASIAHPAILQGLGSPKFDALGLSEVGANSPAAMKVFDEAQWP